MMAIAMHAPSAPAPSEIDRATLARCKGGDPLAFRAFVARYERAVFALLSRMLGPGAHVEDLAQETFLRAYRAIASFDIDGSARVSTWLLTIGGCDLDLARANNHHAPSDVCCVRERSEGRAGKGRSRHAGGLHRVANQRRRRLDGSVSGIQNQREVVRVGSVASEERSVGERVHDRVRKRVRGRVGRAGRKARNERRHSIGGPAKSVSSLNATPLWSGVRCSVARRRGARPAAGTRCECSRGCMRRR